MDQQGEKLQAVDGETQSLRASSNAQAQDLEGVTKRTDKIEEDLKALFSRFEPVEKEWWEFFKTLGGSDENAGRRNIYELFEELEALVKKNSRSIENLQDEKVDLHGPWVAK